jgi:hypothetical protein
MIASLAITNQVSETLGIAVELKIMSDATNFSAQILAFLTNGGSYIVKTLDEIYFHMRRMVRV